MREELTEKMHNEFTVNEETDTKHRVWAMLEEAKRRSLQPYDLMQIYKLSEDDIKKHEQSYLDLNK